MTQEGAAAVQEAIDALKAQKPLPALEWQQEMQQAAKDHVEDMGPDGKTGHTGTDGSQPKDRMSRYGKVEGMSGENIDYGEKEPHEVILALIVDDGVPSRGHRTNIYQVGFKKFACYTGDHKVYKKSTVLNYNGSAAEMNALMEKEVDFGDPPAGCVGWSQSTQAKMSGGKIIKTTTRTYKMSDGSTQEKTITEESDM